MFSMKTHKVISKIIHQHILSMRHEYLLRAPYLSQKQLAPLGELYFLWGNQPPLKTLQLFQHFKNPPSWREIMSPFENNVPLPYSYSLSLMHLHIPPCNHYFIDIYLFLQCCHIVDKYKFVGLFKSLDLTTRWYCKRLFQLCFSLG